eukprot:gene4731-19092_t
MKRREDALPKSPQRARSEHADEEEGEAHGRRPVLRARADRAEAGHGVVCVVGVEAALLDRHRARDQLDLLLQPLRCSLDWVDRERREESAMVGCDQTTEAVRGALALLLARIAEGSPPVIELDEVVARPSEQPAGADEEGGDSAARIAGGLWEVAAAEVREEQRRQEAAQRRIRLAERDEQLRSVASKVREKRQLRSLPRTRSGQEPPREQAAGAADGARSGGGPPRPHGEGGGAGRREPSGARAQDKTPARQLLDAFAEMAEAEPKKREVQLVPNDEILDAMEFTDLVQLAIQCGLPGDCLLDARSALVGLRRYREHGTYSRAESVSAPSFDKRHEEAEVTAITLERGHHASWVPWGLFLERETLELRSAAPGSVAAGSDAARGCVGMVLTQCNGKE